MTFHDDFHLCNTALVRDGLAHNEIANFCITGNADKNAQLLVVLNDIFIKETGKALCQFDQIDYNDRSTRREFENYHMWLWYNEAPDYFTLTDDYGDWLVPDKAIQSMLMEQLTIQTNGIDDRDMDCRLQYHTVTHDGEIDSRAYDVYQYELRDKYVTYNGMTGKIRWSKETQKFWFIKKYARKYGYTVNPISILYDVKPV